MIEPATLVKLAWLLGVEATELQVQPLPGGLSNRSCLLRCGSDRWAVRLPLASCSGEASSPGGPSSSGEASSAGEVSCANETLSLESERQVLALTAEAKLSPPVIACDTETGALITRYLRGATTLNPERMRDPAIIDRAAAMLRRLHSLPAPTGLHTFRPTEMARSYIDAAFRDAAFGPTGTPHEDADELRRWSTEFRHLAQAYEAAFKPTALCHNDLVAANILDDGRLWLVDFEFAVRADPILDLAGLAGLNGFGQAHCRRLLDAYHGPDAAPVYGPDAAPVSVSQLSRVVRLVQLMAYFWALAHGGADASDDRKRFAAAMATVLR